MKVYIAGPYAARDTLAAYASEATRIGYTVTSRWLAETHALDDGSLNAAPALDDSTVDQHAKDDLEDVQSADLLVVFTGKSLGVEAGSGGRHVETGFFIAHQGPGRVIVVGDPENIFHRMRAITCVPDWHEAAVELASRLVMWERAMPQELLS